MVKYLIIAFVSLTLVFANAQQSYAQSFWSRITQKGAYLLPSKSKKHKRYKCGYMDAYNKGRAYRKYKRSGGKGNKNAAPTEYIRRSAPSRAQILAKKDKNNGTITYTADSKQPVSTSKNSGSTNSTSPASASNTTTQRSTYGSSKPTPNSPVNNTGNVAIAAKEPAPDEHPKLSRDALKKMTLQQRRDTLARTTPTEVLPPIQFISGQDEFSVVNMDSFMKAMEYAQQGKVVLIEGHTDDLGREQYNLDLSMKRTEKIRNLLLSAGVADELISVIGYGESQPKVPNVNDENRAINRRIEFKIFVVQ